jgi:hypothetical protein
VQKRHKTDYHFRAHLLVYFQKHRPLEPLLIANAELDEVLDLFLVVEPVLVGTKGVIKKKYFRSFLFSSLDFPKL